MKVSDFLSKDDVAYFTSKSDVHAWRLVLGNWAAIALIFAVMGAFPNVVTIFLGTLLLAGRQLGLSVLMHDCGHHTLFKSNRLNNVVGQWLCALPVLNDQPSYARGHLDHHRKAGTPEDPDLPNYQAYPISKQSFRRKMVRDLTGQTGAKLLAFILRGGSGGMGNGKRDGANVLYQQIGVQLIIFAVLWSFGIAWTYAIWSFSYLTVFMFLVRVRQVAEHAAVPDLYDSDVRMNTRTVEAPWWQRLMFAPCGVNYHMEHHFMASVPCYRLRRLREHLRAQQALVEVQSFDGYGAVLRHAVLR